MYSFIPEMHFWGIVLVLVVLLFLNLCMEYAQALQTIHHHPGLRCILSKTSSIPRLWTFSPEKTITWLEKHKLFESYGWDIVSCTSIWPTTAIAFFVSDPGAIKEITSHRSRFPKLMTDYSILSIFGPNIAASEGLEWKKYRRILAPAYSQETIRTVWEVTFQALHDLHQKWSGLDSVLIDDPAEFAFRLSLEVISITGFGVPLKTTVPHNHTLSFGEALGCVARDGFLKISVPAWIPGITARIRKLRLSYNELQQYMEELVSAKRRGGGGFVREGSLLSNIVEASATGDSGSVHLTRDELFAGNVFISFVAGHETLTDAIAFTLILLAVHPLEQELLYHEVKDVWDGKNIPPWSSRGKFRRASAVLNEALRMFPPVTGLPKYNVDACVLRTCSALSTSEHRDVTVPQGATLIVDIPGLHYNKKYWPEPHVFKPDRFLGSWCESAFQPFSTGSRSCLGREFAETEVIAILASLVFMYKIELHPDLAELDLASLMQKVSDVQHGLSLRPKPLPLMFKRRSNNV